MNQLIKDSYSLPLVGYQHNAIRQNSVFVSQEQKLMLIKNLQRDGVGS